ncbi:MAG: hypothetical protein ACOX7Q_16615 [Kiritimatiellia bacterium]|jgi:hypothetical protein
MKKTRLMSIFAFWALFPTFGEINVLPEDESMARVVRLWTASIDEIPAAQWLADQAATGYHDFPAYKKILQEGRPYDNYTYSTLTELICRIDGVNMCSPGDADIIRLTREFLVSKSGNPDWRFVDYSLLYLSQKGDASDLPLLEKYAELPSKLDFAKNAGLESLRILKARASGTNVLNLSKTRLYCWSTNEPPFLPSVANTGPQAVYVYDLLKQALAKYGDATNLPPELVTMAVSFDADGKPVCSVDPSKYGLVMPDFPPPPPAFTHEPAMTEPPPPTNNVPEKTEAPHIAETPDVPPPAQKRSIVPLAVGVGAGIFVALLLWRGLRKRKQ